MKQIEYIASKILAIIQIAKNIALMFQSKENKSQNYSNNERPNTGNTSGGWRSNNQNRKAQEEQAKREEEMNAYRREKKRKEEEQKAKQNQQNQNREQSQQYQDINETKRRSYEEVLGLKTGWTQEDLRDAYKREAQRTHPDKWTGKPPHIQKIMEEEYKALQEAYNKLKK
jgi:lipopolysaccharide export LptBFGC system permease protein LptF